MAYKPQFKYRVKVTTIQFYDGCEMSRTTKDEGYTWATSAKKAINNIKYRNRLKNNDTGYGNYAIRQQYTAELA